MNSKNSKYDPFYSDLEMKVGEIIAKDPSSINNPEKVFEKASNIKLPKGVVVKFIKAKANEIDIVLPPSPIQVKELQEKKNPLVEHFKSLLLNPNVDFDKEKVTLQQIIAGQAWADPEFMKKLKENPKKALSETLAKSIFKDLTVKLYEETTDTLYVIVPPGIAVGSELGEEELGQVAGGVSVSGIADEIGSVLSSAGSIAKSAVINASDATNKAAKDLFGYEPPEWSYIKK